MMVNVSKLMCYYMGDQNKGIWGSYNRRSRLSDPNGLTIAEQSRINREAIADFIDIF